MGESEIARVPSQVHQESDYRRDHSATFGMVAPEIRYFTYPCNETTLSKTGGCFILLFFLQLPFFLQRVLGFFLLLLSAFICFTRTSHLCFSLFKVMKNYSTAYGFRQAGCS